VLDRTFEAPAPNRKWIADFTYVWTAEGWLYVAAVVDLFSRRVAGWSMSAAMTAQLVTDALMMAIWRRGKPDALLHHGIRISGLHHCSRPATSMGAQGACAVLLAYWSALDRLGANDPDPDCALHILRSRPPAVVLVQWRCASTPRRFSTLRMSGNGDKTVIFSRRADDIRPGENRAEEAVDGGYVHCMRRSGKF
jgi:transposase InsO family protein